MSLGNNKMPMTSALPKCMQQATYAPRPSHCTDERKDYIGFFGAALANARHCSLATEGERKTGCVVSNKTHNVLILPHCPGEEYKIKGADPCVSKHQDYLITKPWSQKHRKRGVLNAAQIAVGV